MTPETTPETPETTPEPTAPETTPEPPKAKPKEKPAPKKRQAAKAENGGKAKSKVSPVEVAEMIEKLVKGGASVKDASETVGKKLDRSPNSLAQTYYRIKRDGSGPAKPRTRRKGKSLADALIEVSGSLRSLSADIRALERDAERNADAAAQLEQVKQRLKAIR